MYQILDYEICYYSDRLHTLGTRLCRTSDRIIRRKPHASLRVRTIEESQTLRNKRKSYTRANTNCCEDVLMRYLRDDLIQRILHFDRKA